MKIAFLAFRAGLIIPVLAVADADPGGDPLSVGKWLLVLGAVLWIYNQAKEAFGFNQPKDSPGVPQPLRTETQHPCVERPDFDKHKEEIWVVINGLRMAIGRLETGLGTNNALREANGERLKEVNTEVLDLGKKVERIAGMVERLIITQEERRK